MSERVLSIIVPIEFEASLFGTDSTFACQVVREC